MCHHRSNRTIVGLKPSQASPFSVNYFGSNRTIVGLKPIAALSLKLALIAAIAPLWD